MGMSWTARPRAQARRLRVRFPYIPSFMGCQYHGLRIHDPAYPGSSPGRSTNHYLFAEELYRGVLSSEAEHHRFSDGSRGIVGPQGVNNLMPGERSW